jgi:cyclin B
MKNVLEKTEIRDSLRAKMVDWMIEVFANYSDTSQIQTYFKAVTIMDLYIKHSKT